jgi:hypothetical protein
VIVGMVALGVALGCSGRGNGPPPVPPPALPTATATPVAFNGSVLLGAPTGSSIRLSLLSANQTGSVSVVLGTSPGVYYQESPTASLTAGAPVQLSLDGLAPDTQYYYRLQFKVAGAASAVRSNEYSFHTARPAGSTFSFSVQADSHLDENSDLDLYKVTLGNILNDHGDFHVDLGDTFMTEKYAAPLTAVATPAPDQATVNSRYVYERANFGLISHSTPLFLVNGNHDGELGWLSGNVNPSLAAWTTQARQRYFLNPTPDAFYAGDSVAEPTVGLRASWYAWQWGDALFIVLDPFWNSTKASNVDAWSLTLGERQYRWLASTLAASRASYKFVFLHNLVGGLDGQMRGGVEAAPYFEWGGKALDGTDQFAQRRPGWAMPIHQLLVQNHVTAVFHGHDHFYARQVLDGIVYQEVPQPSAKNNNSGQNIATDYHYSAGTILSSSGYLRVTVAPGAVTARYVRSWLPKDETAQRKNGSIDDTWTAAPYRVTP